MVFTEISSDYEMYVGRNQNENDALLRKFHHEKNVTWFHLKNMPSPHGFLVCKSNNIPSELIYRTAVHVKKFSKAKRMEVPVDVSWLPLRDIILTDTPGLVMLKKTPNNVCV